jgi:hypothetical protein
MRKRRLEALMTACLGVLLALPGVARAASEGVPCAAEPTDMPIDYGEVVLCDITLGDSDQFDFAGVNGETIVAQAAARGVGNPCLELKRQGSPIRSACGGSSARIDGPLGEDGPYSLVVTESGNNSPMDYTLVLERIAPPSPAASAICPGCSISDGMIDPIGDLDIFVFQGEAGATVMVQASTHGLGNPCIELWRPDGTPMGPPECGGTTGRIDTTLDQSGPYSILVSENGNNASMNYTLTYQCFGVCPTTAPVLECDIQMSQASYVDGETVTANVLRLGNHRPMAVRTEIKIWLGVPTSGAVPIANLVATLPAGFDQNFGPTPLFPVVPALPRGMYEFSCRFLDPITGGLMVVDLNPFQIQ